MLYHWVDIGEEEMAEAFDKVYGNDPWTNWHVTTASEIPGFTSNNNFIVAWNRLLKKYITPGTISIYRQTFIEAYAQYDEASYHRIRCN